ncbi:hypothetical protein BT93_H0115 [Corymbia citriodora subsp. variegata]|nr:hypothetical protein BT93_H0115 [Corymbia citriodora subsp. variegata]
MTAKMHFPSSTTSSSYSLTTIFCLLLVIISLFHPGASAGLPKTRYVRESHSAHNIQWTKHPFYLRKVWGSHSPHHRQWKYVAAKP